MDVRDIQYPDKYFDLVIDKSTIDALLCGDKSFTNVAIMLKEVQRVLKDQGVYMIVSYGSPEYRIFHLDRDYLNFDISIYTIKKEYYMYDEDRKHDKIHYVYLCRKLKDSDKISKEKFENVLKFLEENDKYDQNFNQEEEFDENQEEDDEEEGEIDSDNYDLGYVVNDNIPEPLNKKETEEFNTDAYIKKPN